MARRVNPPRRETAYTGQRVLLSVAQAERGGLGSGPTTFAEGSSAHAKGSLEPHSTTQGHSSVEAQWEEEPIP